MANGDWPRNWERRSKHRKATVRTWDNGKAKERSASHGGHSQYNPHKFKTDESVQQIELACAEGSPHARRIGGAASGHVRKFYMDARVFFGDPTIIVGVC